MSSKLLRTLVGGLFEIKYITLPILEHVENGLGALLQSRFDCSVQELDPLHGRPYLNHEFVLLLHYNSSAQDRSCRRVHTLRCFIDVKDELGP